MINKIKRQSGFTLVEMAIVLIIVGLFLGGAAKYEKIKNAENYGENIGTQMQVRLGALVSYGANNFDDIVAGNAIPGVAVNTAPTIPELQALGFLDPSYNDTGILPAGTLER